MSLAPDQNFEEYEEFTKPFQILESTLEQLYTALDTGVVNSEQLVNFYLDRIAAYDRLGPALHAMIHLNPNAIAQARELDEERKRQGARGVFHGIPVILKDNYSTRDLPTTCGIPAFREFYPEHDAHVVKRLKNAGAIILGKANLHELALFGTTYSTLGGQTKNPYDLTKTPGGSSGGTGAAVSANFAAVGLGTDAVNSVRSPASANNLVGIRPTKGLVNLEGIIPVSSTQDNAGPIARNVADAALLLGVMSTGRATTYEDALAADVRGTLRRHVLEVMNRYRLDALLYPHQKRLVVDIGETNQSDRNGILSALTGCPAITFQGGFSRPTQQAPLGVPVGIELMGKHYAEHTLISLAEAFERETHHRRLPPYTPALV